MDLTQYDNLIDLHATAEFQDQQFNNINEWGQSHIEHTDEMMEQGDLPMAGMFRHYFTFIDGGDDYSINYWEDNNEIDLHSSWAARTINRNISDELEQRPSLDDLPFDDATRDAIEEEIEERRQDLDMNQSHDQHAFWRPERNRRPVDHPDFETMVRELEDQERLNEVEENEEEDINDPARWEDGEDEEGLHEDIFGDGYNLEGHYTNAGLMNEFRGQIERNNELIRQQHALFQQPLQVGRQVLQAFVSDMNLPHINQEPIQNPVQGLVAQPMDLPPIQMDVNPLQNIL